MALPAKIARPPRSDDPEDLRQWLEEVERVINLLLANQSASVYAPTNVTPDRAYDANATSTDELADVLGTLIADLQALEVIA